MHAHKQIEMFSFFKLFIIILGILKIINAQERNPIVTTSLGVIEGYWTKTINNRTYAAFAGIPYALPPIGEFRFQDPKPSESWSGIWKANTEYTCIQYNQYKAHDEDHVVGDEDCLYLNIYTPDVNETRNLDVIVYIHGGGFMFGSGNAYGHRYILDRDIIFVSLNYRLGPLGFLSTEDENLPGNIGLKDQLLALKWVKANIKSFGGNPNSITLTGMSAGGASVHLHIISPLSKGLFHRSIIQSGTALNAWVLTENSLQKARKLGNSLGCDTNNTRTLVDCLKTRSARQIVDAVKHFHVVWFHKPFTPFGVVIDKFSQNPILPAHPHHLLKNGQFDLNIPVIFSCVSSEGLFPVADFIYESKNFDNIEGKWDEVQEYILDYNLTVLPDKKEYIHNKIKKFYLGDKKIVKENFPILIKIATDRLFISDIELASKLHASHANASIYFYHFSYRGAHSKSESRLHSNENYGAAHCDDTVYVLSSTVDTRSTPSDIKMGDLLINMWTNYARNGQPKLGDFESWVPMGKDLDSDIKYMHIESPENIKMKSIKSLGNREFWTTLGLLENENFSNR